jgi:hypothetical protein
VPRRVRAQFADDAGDDGRARLPGGGAALGDDDGEEPASVDWSRLWAAVQRHKVTLASLALIAGSLIWTAAFLSHYFYWEDDFQILDVSLKSHLSWGFLTHVDFGHFFPAVYLIAWVLARVALYNWLAGLLIVLALHAAAGLAAWRLLRTLLGNRSAILIPLTLYVLSPLAFPTDAWWDNAVETIPLQIALFMALNSHLQYVWTGKFRHAVASAAWQLFGLVFFEKAMVIPLLLFAVTAGFLSGWRLLPALRATAVQLWRGWLLYLGLLAAYAAVFLTSLSAATSGPVAPVAQAVSVFARRQVFKTLLPGLLGGPWHWYHPANYFSAFADPPADLEWLAVPVVLGLVAASIVVRRRAWRAWLILVVWLVVADTVPVLIGRLNSPAYAGLHGLQTRYVADVPAVLAIVVALVFWPVADPRPDSERTARRRRDFFTGRWRMIAIAVTAIFVIGSIYSVQSFQTQTTTWTVTSGQAYIANARAALADTPAGSVIVSQPVPGTLMKGTFGDADLTSSVLGPLSGRGSQISWTTRPSGTVGALKVFGGDGRLWPAALRGSSTADLPAWRSCLSTTTPQLVLHFQPVSTAFASTLRIGYVANSSAAGQVVQVYYGSESGQFTVQPGENHYYLPVHGSAGSVVLSSQGDFSGLCFGPAIAGYIVPFPGFPIPRIGS